MMLLIFIIIIIFLSFLMWRQLFIFYAPNQWDILEGNKPPLYSVTVYRKNKNCKSTCNAMINIKPQNVYIFVENKKLIVYHPIQQFHFTTLCPVTHPDRAFILSNPPRQICRISLDSLKRHDYKYVVTKLHLICQSHNV